jgi:hypothetical protein
MRTLPAGLASALKTSTPYAVLIGNLDGAGDDGTAQVIEYTLTQHTLSAKIENGTSALDSFSQCRLRRGAEIAGVPTYVDTSKLWIRSIVQYETYVEVEASIFPQRYISLAGDDTYENVLTAFAAAIGFTAEFANPAAAFWQYQFLPTGRALTMNDARHLLSMLQQKYLIQAMDAGSETVRFFCVPNSDAIADQTPNDPRLVAFGVRPYQSRRFLWRDEANTLHQAGNAARRQFGCHLPSRHASAFPIPRARVLPAKQPWCAPQSSCAHVHPIASAQKETLLLMMLGRNQS